ncbi:MAG: hypothetical protein Q8P36_01460 [bacterium]|nr:hypothetical protein [bacterium]
MRSNGKYRNAVERDFLKQVLTVLLSAKGSCLHAHTGNGFVSLCTDGPQHFAIEQLIEHFGSHEGLADLAASAYLDRFEQRPRGLLAHTDALEYAYRIATRFPLSREVRERLVRSVALAGWHGRLEGLAKTLCKRVPRAEEVILLFDNYAGGAVDSTSTEERLLAYAAKYLSSDAAHIQRARIDKHRRNAQFD